jgi:hypothetical protein
MSNSAAKRGTEPSTPSGAASPAEPAADRSPPRPLKPRPALLAATSLLFAGWVLFLAGLYFKTEYPRRSTAPRPDAKGVLVPEAPTPPRR